MDPLLLNQDKLSKKVPDPQALNTYAYSRNNPIVLIDPNGEDFRDFAIQLNIFAFSLASNLLGVERALAPTSEAEISQTSVATKNVGELYLPGYESIPRPARFGIGLAAGLLAPELRANEAKNLAKSTADEVVTLFHGSRHNATEIFEKGFHGNVWLTDSRALAETYKLGDTGAKDPGVIKVLVPKSVWESLISSSKDTFIKDVGQFGWPGKHEFNILTQRGKEIINKFIDKLEY